MPGAMHRFTRQDALGEGAAVVGAFGADCEDFVVDAGEEDCLLPRAAADQAAVVKIGRRHALGEVWTIRSFGLMRHVVSLAFGSCQQIPRPIGRETDAKVPNRDLYSASLGTFLPAGRQIVS